MSRIIVRAAVALFAVLLTAGAGGAAVAAPVLDTGDCLPPAPTYHSRPDLRPIGACAYLDTGSAAPGYLFASSKGPGRGGPTIYANDGSVIWNKPETVADTHNFQVVTVQGKKRLVYFRGTWLVYGLDTRGEYVMLDENYREVGTIKTNATNSPGLHELRITPEGTALVGAYTPVIRVVSGRPVVVYDYVVQEVDFQRGNKILFEWRALDHIPLSQSHLPVPGPLGIFDYFHGNSIEVMPDGDLLISGRHTWSVYKVSRKDGRVLWTLGKPADGSSSFGTELLNSDAGWFCYQHDARVEADGTISLFDNGNGGPGCGHASRGLKVRLDEAAKTATVVDTVRHQPEISATFGGDISTQPNGNRLVSWGETQRVTEFDAAGRPVLEMNFGQINYRVYRSEWQGFPLTPPTAVRDGSQLVVSWNGATEVASWQLLGGSDEGDLRPVGAPIPRAGFETSIAVPAGTAAVGVQALDAAGKPLDHGHAVAGPAPEGPSTLGVVGKTVLLMLAIFGGFGMTLWMALIAGLVLGLVWAVIRLATRKGLRKALYGLAGMVLLIMLVNVTGGLAQSFYPPLIYLNIIYPLAFLVANLVGWPLVGIVTGLLSGSGGAWRRDPRRMRAYRVAGWLWLGFFAVKTAVQMPLYLTSNWVGLGIAKTLLGWPLWIVTTIVTVVVVRRMIRPAAVAAEPEPEPTPAEAEPTPTPVEAEPATQGA
ncbi:arylsulfotransferase family protein [Micromonospora chokoriensis]|uniref:arylsulfotransferase family protein n=1 Tax=Micromonospora chokoriensis TaxID=356851 RepID=UPI0004C4083F|nr:arylsulfotransferase family protein [Micromonospora chokoriensis]